MFPSILYLSGFCLVFDIALPRPYTFSVTGVIKRTWTELTVCVGWNQRHMKPPVLLIIFTFVMKMPWSTVENQTNMLLASCPIKDKGGWLFNCFFFPFCFVFVSFYSPLWPLLHFSLNFDIWRKLGISEELEITVWKIKTEPPSRCRNFISCPVPGFSI